LVDKISKNYKEEVKNLTYFKFCPTSMRLFEIKNGVDVILGYRFILPIELVETSLALLFSAVQNEHRYGSYAIHYSTTGVHFTIILFQSTKGVFGPSMILI